MFIERKINATTQAVELWKCEWENREGHPARKVFLEKVGEEQPLSHGGQTAMKPVPAICWSYGRTLGNIAVYSPTMLGSFPSKSGNDAVLTCDFVNAGKFRHGVARWWCRTHQAHWGTKADLESYDRTKVMRCSNHEQRMNYVVGPFEIKIGAADEVVGVWCSMPPAISSVPIGSRPPKIHVHVRPNAGAAKTVDRDFGAVAMQYAGGLFQNEDITRVNITPPAAFEFVRGLETGRDMGCINCSHCGYPHLDLGDFATRPHRKHFCANCGRDSTWSSKPIVSTPLKPMHDQFPQASQYVEPDRVLDLDDYNGCQYTVWASTPAVIWTAARAQERGIHVHVHNGAERVVDDTFGKVTLKGHRLSRDELFNQMVARTVI